jgi:hypothetical protein
MTGVPDRSLGRGIGVTERHWVRLASGIAAAGIVLAFSCGLLVGVVGMRVKDALVYRPATVQAATVRDRIDPPVTDTDTPSPTATPSTTPTPSLTPTLWMTPTLTATPAPTLTPLAISGSIRPAAPATMDTPAPLQTRNPSSARGTRPPGSRHNWTRPPQTN